MLSDIKLVSDAVSHFQIPQKDTTALEDIAQISNRPKNLHINLEPIRYNPNSNDFFSVTAFPDRPTIVSSVKYKKKYKGSEETAQ